MAKAMGLLSVAEGAVGGIVAGVFCAEWAAKSPELIKHKEGGDNHYRMPNDGSSRSKCREYQCCI